MLYADIFDEVKNAVKRGDIDQKITAAIRAMTLYMHRTDFYWRDLIESDLNFQVPTSIAAVNVLSILPRFRQVKYVRYWDPATGLEGAMLKPMDPSAVLDEYGYEKLDRYYAAGDVLKLRFYIATNGCQIAYYASPVVTPAANYTSWIADQFPDVIIQGSIAAILNQTGKNEEAAQVNKWVGIISGHDPRNGPTLIEQLKQFALEESAR